MRYKISPVAFKKGDGKLVLGLISGHSIILQLLKGYGEAGSLVSRARNLRSR